MHRLPVFMLVAAACAAASAQTVVSHYDDLAEGFYGTQFTYKGVTYRNVNNVPGVFPDGETFDATGDFGLGHQIIVENATFLHNDFPGWGSPNNVLTFGSAFVPDDNLSLGAISTVTMELDAIATFASFKMAYYENGPWGGIVYHFEAYMGGSLVASDSFTISNLGGRDNIAFATMTVSGAQFDSMRLFATYGDEYSGPRIVMDDLSVRYIPAPGTPALLGLGALAGRRRR